MNRKNKINEILIQITEKGIKDSNLDNIGIDALYISQLANIDRSNASKDLNRLWREGRATKIQGYPIRYISRDVFENFYNLKDFPSLILKDENIRQFLTGGLKFKEKNATLSLDSIIGATSSINSQINDAKAAISYPPNGINLLIIGNRGLDKNTIVSSLHQYAKTTHKKSTSSKLVTVDCTNYASSDSNIVKFFVGDELDKTLGFIEQSNKGTIYLDNIQTLDKISLNKILEIIEHGYYSKIGSVNIKMLDCMIIASITPDSANTIALLKQYFPTIITIPDIEQRGMFEKIEQILSIFLKESVQIKKDIQISKDLLLIFASHIYENNLIGMRSEIKQACSRAYLTTNPNTSIIKLSYKDLSLNMISKYSPYSSNIQAIKSILSTLPNEVITFESSNYCQSLDNLTNQAKDFNVYRFDQFLRELDFNINSINNKHDFIYENISTIINCGKVQQTKIKLSINPFLVNLFEDIITTSPFSQEYIKNKEIFLGLILHLSNILKKDTNDIVNTDVSPIKLTTPSLNTAYKIIVELHKQYNINFTNDDLYFISMYLDIGHTFSQKTYVPALLICHGKSIASELKEQLHLTFGANLPLYAINYAPSFQFNDILEAALYKCNEINSNQGILIITDDYSLESISDYIFKETNIYTNTITTFNRDTLYKICKEIMDYCSLDQIIYHNKRHVIDYSVTNRVSDNNSFLYRLIKNFIQPTLIFLDGEKAADCLMISFSKILEEMNLDYSNELATKFLCHSVNMIERVIKNDTFKYKKVRKFIEENNQIYRIIEKSLSNVNEIFGITIPKEELAYITEIFLL